MLVDVDLKEGHPMDRRNVETIGVRRTGWAALDRDPQQDKAEFVCPYCGARDKFPSAASKRWVFVRNRQPRSVVVQFAESASIIRFHSAG